jgi:tetratricopeptide (TPR) repeat protein
MSKKKIRRKPSHARRLPHNVLERIDQADALIARQHYAKALAILDPLDAKYPDRIEILSSQAVCCFRLGMHERYLGLSLKLHRMLPQEPHGLLALAQAYLLCGRMALARREYQRYLERWPGGADVEHAREALERIEPELDRMLATVGLVGEDRYELAALHEDSQVLMGQGQMTQARETAEELLRRQPDFIPALNNLSQIYFLDRRTGEAIAAAERVLEIAPQNFHALGNLARYLFLSGRTEEAQRMAERLKSAPSDLPDIWIKKAETFSYLGDDQAVLETFQNAETAGALEDANPFLYHLTAVAALRLGQEDRARELWKRCLKASPGFELAEANLDDLQKPVGERNGPWAFPLNYLLRREALEEMIKEAKVKDRRSGEALTHALQHYVERHPEITHLIPYLLERGDPIGRDFAVRLAGIIKTPEMLAMLRDFALSQRGTDRLRMQAAQAASQADLLPSGQVRMWMQGEWQEILLLGFEIHGEPEGPFLPPKVERLVAQGMEDVYYGDGVKGERLLKQALELAPDHPSILNNLAAAYGIQGKIEESEKLIEEIHQKFPDYFFGRTNLATHYARRGRVDEAEELLKPLLNYKRLHFSEYSALCGAQIELALARKNRQAARSWIQMWEQADPDNPQLARFRLRIEPPNLGQLLRGLRR